MTTGRIEAFSDGVFAIAITLLVLEIDVPERPPDGLGHALLDQWPSYASYVVSFLIIAIIWVDHHAVFVVIGTPLYAVTVAVALVSAPLCLALNALLAVYYALPVGGAMPHRRV